MVGIDVVVLMGSVTEEDPDARSQPYVFRHCSVATQDEDRGPSRTYERIKIATVLRSHRYALSSALAVAGTWSCFPACSITVLFVETVKRLEAVSGELFSLCCAQRNVSLVHTIGGARVTVRIVAAEDDSGASASFAEGRVCLGAVWI